MLLKNLEITNQLRKKLVKKDIQTDKSESIPLKILSKNPSDNFSDLFIRFLIFLRAVANKKPMLTT